LQVAGCTLQVVVVIVMIVMIVTGLLESSTSEFSILNSNLNITFC